MLDETRIEDPWYDIASYIEERRTQQGLSRQALAQRLDVSRATIFNWESGRRIPVEKCAAIAEGLGVSADDLLQLHPEVVTVNRPDREIAADDSGQTVRLTKRELLFVALGIAALVIGIGFVAWSTASTECFTVGAGLASSSGPFREAYADAGGRDALGCAVDEIHKYGPGIVQRVAGGTLNDGLILSLDRRNAHVFAGELYYAYDRISEGASADVAGHPIDSPRRCGDSIIVRLGGGAAGAGALVQSADRSTYIWLGAGVWPEYIAMGGPVGLLGSPTASRWHDAGFEAEFEFGSIIALHGEAPVVTGGEPTPTHLEPATCPAVSVRDAAGI